jgi:hypothetical protein
MGEPKQSDIRLPEFRRIARECPIGSLVLHEVEAGRVYYVEENQKILTEFTSHDIDDNQHLPDRDPDFLEWTKGNGDISGPQFDFYTVRGK